MEAKELRQFSVDELNGRIKQWKEEYFRNHFKGQTSETPNTAIFRTLRRSIARAKTILNEKLASGQTQGVPQAAREAAPVTAVEDKPVKKAKAKTSAPKEEKAPKKASSKKAKGE